MTFRNHPRFNFLTIMIASLFALALVAPVFGQQAATATIEGVVTDPNNAAVPGAKVTIKNVDTGLKREITTDASGIYRIAALPPGAYEISAGAEGFTENKYGSVTLTVGQKLNLDLKLRVTVSEAVNITDVAPIVETTRPNVSASVGERAVRELPVNGRNFLDFVTLTPGVVRDPRAGDLSFGGQKGTLNSIQIDGVDNNNLFFGQAAAGTINVITKSGTNEFHGEVFEFFRDRSLNANSLRYDSGLEAFTGGKPALIPNGFAFNPASQSVVGSPNKPPYHFNQFGGSVGGPIKKDRLFFFFNYDGQRNTQPNLVNPLPAAIATDPLSVAGRNLLLPLAVNYTRGFDQDV